MRGDRYGIAFVMLLVTASCAADDNDLTGRWELFLTAQGTGECGLTPGETYSQILDIGEMSNTEGLLRGTGNIVGKPGSTAQVDKSSDSARVQISSSHPFTTQDGTAMFQTLEGVLDDGSNGNGTVAAYRMSDFMMTCAQAVTIEVQNR